MAAEIVKPAGRAAVHDSSEERLRLALEATDLAVWDYDPLFGVFQSVGKPKELWGLKPEESLSYTAWLQRLHPEDRQRADTAVQQALDPAGSGQLDFQYRVVLPDDSIRWLAARGQTQFTQADGQRRAVRVTGTALDITQQMQVHEALTHSEAMFRATFEGSAIGMAWVSLDGKVLRSNGTLQTMLGYNAEDLEGKRVVDLTHPDDRTTDGQLYGQMLAGQRKGYQIEKRYVRKDGGVFWARLTVSAVRDAAGRVQFSVGALLDISEQKQASEILQESEQRFRTLADGTPVLIWVNGADGCQFANQAYLEFLGAASEKDVRQFNWASFIHPEDRERYVQSYQACVQRREPFEATFRFRRHDGVYRWMHSTALPRISDSGELLGYIGNTVDITDRRQAEADSRRNEERLESLLRISHYRARSIQELLDFTLEEAVRLTGSKIGYIYHYDETTRQFTLNSWSRQVMHQCSIVQPQTVYQLDKTGIWGEAVRQARPIIVNDFAAPNPLRKGYPEGHSVLHKFMTVPVQVDGHIVGVVGVANKETDYDHSDVRQLTLLMDAVWKIADRRRAEESLRELNETLERRVAERTAVAEERARQLQVLANQLTRAEERERRRVAHILHEHFQQLLVGAKFDISLMQSQLCGRPGCKGPPILERINAVLDQSITESRSLTVELSPPILHVAGLAAALEWLGQWMQEKHGLSVSVEVDKSAEPVSEDVRILLFQGVRELLFNIVKHAGVKQARVRMDRTQQEDIRILVSDQGCGFDLHVVDRNSGTGGFGIFSLRERLEFIGGRLQIDSHPSQGATLTLLVPAQATRVNRSETKGRPHPHGEPGRTHGVGSTGIDGKRKIRILLADDHLVVRDGLARLLERQPDFQVVGQAADGQQAVDLVLRLRPDVVLMDVSMPGLSGVEATRCIVSQVPQVRVVGLSMYTDAGVASSMAEAGAVSYVRKTAPPEYLLAAIRAAMEKVAQSQ